jgi:hypothetical protein
MKKFTLVLLAINVVTISWLVIGARMELPPWEKAFDDARSAINNLNLNQPGGIDAIDQAVLHSRVKAAEALSRITIDEYRRSDAPLVVLAFINMFGLATMALKNRKPNLAAHSKEGSAPD